MHYYSSLGNKKVMLFAKFRRIMSFPPLKLSLQPFRLCARDLSIRQDSKVSSLLLDSSCC